MGRSDEPFEVRAQLFRGELRFSEFSTRQFGYAFHFVGIDGKRFAVFQRKAHPFEFRNVRIFNGGFHQIVPNAFSEIEKSAPFRFFPFDGGIGFRFPRTEVVEIGREKRQRAEKEKIGLELAEYPVVW